MLKLIYTERLIAKVSKEKQVYNLLRKHFFKKAIKMYSTVFKGFPDFIVIEAKPPLPSGFYEVKFVRKSVSSSFEKLLSPHQKKAFQLLSQAFPCVLVLAQPVQEDAGNVVELQFHLYIPHSAQFSAS